MERGGKERERKKRRRKRQRKKERRRNEGNRWVEIYGGVPKGEKRWRKWSVMYMYIQLLSTHLQCRIMSGKSVCELSSSLCLSLGHDPARVDSDRRPCPLCVTIDVVHVKCAAICILKEREKNIILEEREKKTQPDRAVYASAHTASHSQ